MGGYTGRYSRDPFAVFNEEKNYAFALMQEGIPVTDDDENDNRISLYTRSRRLVQLFGQYGTSNNGFRIAAASSPADNFKILGGGPGNADIEAAGRFFMRGIGCILLRDVDYLNPLSDIPEQSIHPRITNFYFDGISETVLEDSAAGWVAGELVSRTITLPGGTHAIASNTVDEIRITGDVTADASIGDYYILELSTPTSSPRTDEVYLNVYLDEYDAADDPDIEKDIGGQTVEAQLRAKVIQTIYVREDIVTYAPLVDYVDSNGNQHYVFRLASLARTTSPNIDSGMITDHVGTIGFENISQAQLADLKVSENPAGADDQVYVQAGRCRSTLGVEEVIFTGGLSPVTSAPSGSARYDILYIDDSGTLGIFEGQEGAGVPAFPVGIGTCLASLYVDEVGGPVVIDDDDIADIRPYVGEAASPYILVGPAQDLASVVSGAPAGSRFLLMPGTHTPSSSVTLGSGMTLSGCGKSQTTIALDDPVILTLGTGATVQDVAIDTIDAVGTASSFVAMGTDSVLRRCSLSKSVGTFRGSGVVVSATTVTALIEQCWFDSSFQDDASVNHIEIASTVVADRSVVIRDNYFNPHNCARVIDSTGSATFEVVSNRVETVAGTAIQAFIGVDSAVDFVVKNNYEIVGGATISSFLRIDGSAPSAGSGMQVTGNRMRSQVLVTRQGAGTLENFAILGNIVTSSGGAGLFSSSGGALGVFDFTMSNNVLDGAVNQDIISMINLSEMVRGTIADNVVTGATRFLRLEGVVANLVVNGNKVTGDSTEAAIELLGATTKSDIVVTGNHFSGFTYGVNIGDAGIAVGDFSITSNYFTDITTKGVFVYMPINPSIIQISDNVIEGMNVTDSVGIDVRKAASDYTRSTDNQLTITNNTITSGTPASEIESMMGINIEYPNGYSVINGNNVKLEGNINTPVGIKLQTYAGTTVQGFSVVTRFLINNNSVLIHSTSEMTSTSSSDYVTGIYVWSYTASTSGLTFFGEQSVSYNRVSVFCSGTNSTIHKYIVGVGFGRSSPQFGTDKPGNIDGNTIYVSNADDPFSKDGTPGPKSHNTQTRPMRGLEVSIGGNGWSVSNNSVTMEDWSSYVSSLQELGIWMISLEDMTFTGNSSRLVYNGGITGSSARQAVGYRFESVVDSSICGNTVKINNRLGDFSTTYAVQFTNCIRLTITGNHWASVATGYTSGSTFGGTNPGGCVVIGNSFKTGEPLPLAWPTIMEASGTSVNKN